jgi:hypothetical protein
MTTKPLVVAAVAALLVSLPGSSQTASDLLQKGIHLQEAAGDVDGAIVFFRQVVSSAAATNKALAAQAQYQLVLCMLQKGDRTAASKELAALENNYSDLPDLVSKARKLIPGSAALLPSPWGENEALQLNIRRNGEFTGEYLYYSADTWGTTVGESRRKDEMNSPNSPYPQSLSLRWELTTKASTRSIALLVDRDTLRPMEDNRNPNNKRTERPYYSSDDDLGDALATPFTGPATDAEQTVFLMRRLPLAVGYKTTVPVTSNSIEPSQLELTVTGIESVQTLAGKFNCYKVSFNRVGQTFWIGVEGARPLVKFQSGAVEAELVKTWGPETLLESVAAITRKAGGSLSNAVVNPGGTVQAVLWIPNTGQMTVTLRKRYTPRGDIAQELQTSLAAKTSEQSPNPRYDYKWRPGSTQTRQTGGQQALSCLLDRIVGSDASGLQKRTAYAVWIRTENAAVEFWIELESAAVGTFRWQFEPILQAIHIP